MADQNFFNCLSYLRCPETGGELIEKEGQLVSLEQPHQVFPIWEGIPWLLRSPNSYWEQWQIRLQIFLQGFETLIQVLKLELEKKGVREGAKLRLELLHQALSHNKNAFKARLKGFKLNTTVNSNMAMFRDQVSATQHAESYFQNVFRDWIWGHRENEIALQSVCKSLGSHQPKSLAVVGSGAGRMAYDLIEHLKPKDSFLIDINPVLMSLAKDCFEGKTFELFEVPRLPLSSQTAAIKHTFKANPSQGSNVHFIFGDATNLPLKSKSIDTLVTPWLIDILPMKTDALALHLNRVLVDGGRWIFFGPLTFESLSYAERYTIDELPSILEDCGFEFSPAVSQRIPYLQSPHDGHWREENAWTFCAIKKKHLEPQEHFSVLPNWLRDYDLPVPVDQYLAPKFMNYATLVQIMPLIDGSRSINDLVKTLSSRFQVPENECRKNLIGLLIPLYNLKT